MKKSKPFYNELINDTKGFKPNGYDINNERNYIFKSVDISKPKLNNNSTFNHRLTIDNYLERPVKKKVKRTNKDIANSTLVRSLKESSYTWQIIQDFKKDDRFFDSLGLA